MQTKAYTAKKSLGQHFLRDANIARNIVAALDPRTGDRVLEIGPGQGVLTELLSASGARVVAVDIDRRSVEVLRTRFQEKEHPNVSILHADILTLDLKDMAKRLGGPLRVIGNLPYNITSRILFHIFDAHENVQDALFMMQREVADRLVAKHGGKNYSRLSVMTQVHAHVERRFHVSPNVFIPRPKVWSSVVYLRIHRERLSQIRNYSFFRSLVTATFGKRRKTIFNSLRFAGIDTATLPPAFTGYLKLRPEQLTVDEFIQLANSLEGHDGYA